jgi:Ni/Co efflux regulator RcnB
MNALLKHPARSLALSLALGLCLAPALAEKPDHAGGGKHDKHDKWDKGGKKDRDENRDGQRSQVQRDSGTRSSSNVVVQINIGGYFQDNQRMAVREYYEPRFREGRCPPGLAKKHNGCMPPGQARKWRKGYRLPSDVVYYAVPADVSIRLGAPPSGYKYVRVAADILLIAVGTSMVVDAIEDLSRF